MTDLDAAVQHAEPEDAQGPAGVHPGHRRTVRRTRARRCGASTEYFAPALTSTDHFFAELVARPARVHAASSSKPRRPSRRSARARKQLTDLDRKREHDLPGDRLRADRARPGPAKSCPVTLNQGNRTFAELPATFAALTELVERVEADEQAADDAARTAAAAAHDRDAGGAQLQRSVQPPRAQQRPDRPRATRCPRSPQR